MAHKTVGSPVNIYIQEGEAALNFGPHSEMNAVVDAI
jgi:hypothetical protein